MEQNAHWAAMSEGEKQEELKQKREELKEKRREKAKERREKEMLVRREQSRRYEDQEIGGGENLPTFRHVDMPEGLPNALFGDIAMVVDFLNAYTGLLMPDAQYPITGVALMEALAGEGSGFLYLNHLLVMLLQTLLQDELAEGYSELDTPLSEIPLTLHSVSELVRLCLRPRDAHGEESSKDSEDGGSLGGFDAMVTSEILERLEMAEVFELNPQEKGSLLVALCHCILMTHSVEDHIVAMQQRSAELWKDRLATLKEVNDRKKAEIKRHKEEMEGKVKEDGGIPKGQKKKDGSAKKDKEEENKEVKVEPEPEDMISVVRSRQLMSMQAKKEKKEQDRQNKERMEKEAEEERICRQKVAAERAFQDAVTKAKLVLRSLPLGTDRNHNRYWLFSDMVPGLYIEKCWVHESIDYNYTPPSEEKPVEDKPAEAEVEEDEDGAEKDGSTDGVMSEVAQQGAAADVCIETTVPKQGQNLWFVCDTQPDLEELVEKLHPQGVRESELKAKIQSKYQDILHSIHLSPKVEIGLRAGDGHEELIKDLRSDINEVASRLQKGSLGYLDDNAIENLVSEMESLNEFGECIITIQACVIKKFLQGFMAPKQQKKKKQGGEENSKDGEVDERKLAEEARVATAVEKWKTAIHDAQTFSRMHVLLSMLDACINWDMSAENAHCKVCRKKALPKKQSLAEQSRSREPYSHRLRAKQASVTELCSRTGGGDRLILCDDCKKAFHLFCLRPVLHCIPAGEWLCPACQSATARQNYKEGTDEENDEDDSEDDEEEEEENEENDYKEDIGQSMRPRKKSKQSPSRPKGSKTKPKKQSPPRGQSSRQRTSHSSHTEIDELGVCEEILQKLIKFRYSRPFREPMSSEEAEDYLKIISTPMDFQTMLGKLSQGSYRHAQAFLEDMKLVFSNAEEYNHEGISTVLSCLTKTEQSLTDLLQKLLPGISYLRRHTRKRVSRAAVNSEEQQNVKKMQNGKSTQPRREAVGQERKTRYVRGRKEEENKSEEEEDEGNSKWRSKQTSGKRDYRGQNSGGERDTQRTQQQGAQRERAGSSDVDNSDLRRSLRHNKRQKRS